MKVQWAAVRTHLLLSREPPHQTVLPPLTPSNNSLSECYHHPYLVYEPRLPGVLVNLRLLTSYNLGSALGQAAPAVTRDTCNRGEAAVLRKGSGSICCEDDLLVG